jgi:hypothetical protein
MKTNYRTPRLGQPALQVALAHPRDLAMVPTDGCSGRAHAVAAVEEQENADSTPTTWRQGASVHAASSAAQLGPPLAASIL